MADVTITAANVMAGGTDCRVICVQLGEACTAGDQVYRDTSDSKYYRGDNTASNKATIAGTLLTGGSTNEYAVLCYDGPVVIGGTVVKGESYMASDNLGKLMPIGDLTSGDLETFCCFATSTTEVQVSPLATGVTTP